MKKYVFILCAVFILGLLGASYNNPKPMIIPVIMCYSDTALTELVGTDDNGDEYEEMGLDQYCYWRKGYVVGENEFLDSNKDKIPATNVVWIYKKLR